MVHKEYKTVEGKVVLLTTTFSWGTTLLSKKDLLNELFSISAEEAKYVSDSYREGVDAIIRKYDEKPEYPEKEEEKNAEITQLANTLKQELLDKGYVLGKDIEVIIHE